MKKKYIKLLSIVISGILITILYKKINVDEFFIILNESKKSFLLSSIFISIILGFIGGFRYSYFAKYLRLIPAPNFLTSTKGYFISSAFNLLLPSKLGDLTKGLICSNIDNKNYNKSLFFYTIYEKLSDLGALFFIVLILYFDSRFLFFLDNPKLNFVVSIIEENKINYLLIIINFILIFLISPLSRLILKHKFFAKNSYSFNNIKNFSLSLDFKKFINYQSFSIFVWLLHLFQIALFAYSINMNLFSSTGFLSIGIVILFGLLPVSFAGIGARDVLLIFIFGNSYGNVKPLLLGFMMTLRYILPATIGIISMRELTKEN